MIQSHNGVFKATMDARAGTFLVNGKPVKGLKTFNGTYPGPTLAMKPGDHVEITFINHLTSRRTFTSTASASRRRTSATTSCG